MIGGYYYAKDKVKVIRLKRLSASCMEGSVRVGESTQRGGGVQVMGEVWCKSTEEGEGTVNEEV